RRDAPGHTALPAQTARWIGGSGHGGATVASRRVGRNFGGTRVGKADASVPLKMVLAARWAVALAGIFLTQAGQFVAATDAIAVAGFRSCFDGHQCHGTPSQAR